MQLVTLLFLLKRRVQLQIQNGEAASYGRLPAAFLIFGHWPTHGYTYNDADDEGNQGNDNDG